MFDLNNRKSKITNRKSNDLPRGWMWTKLGEICEKPQYGWTTSADFNGQGLKLLRTTDISSGTINWSRKGDGSILILIVNDKGDGSK